MDAEAKKIRIIFRGVRGSFPVPGGSTLAFGGNTACQEIRVGGRLLIFDAGTGIIGLGRELRSTPEGRNFALFFSHNHHDHTGGFLYFKPAYDKNATIHIYGPTDGAGSIIEALESLSAPAAHPVPFSRMGMNFTAHAIDTGSVVRWAPGRDRPDLLSPGESPGPDDVVVRVMRNPLHPIGGVLNLRLEYGGRSYVYATDVEGDEEQGDAALAAFARDADLLAHDGQFTTEDYLANYRGWGHSTVKMAIKTAVMAGAKRLAIIHYEPSYDDTKLAMMEKEAGTMFHDVFFAREGQCVEL